MKAMQLFSLGLKLITPTWGNDLILLGIKIEHIRQLLRQFYIVAFSSSDPNQPDAITKRDELAAKIDSKLGEMV